MVDAEAAKRARAGKKTVLGNRITNLTSLLDQDMPLDALEESYRDVKMAKDGLEGAHEAYVVLVAQNVIDDEGDYLAVPTANFTKIQGRYFKKKKEMTDALQLEGVLIEKEHRKA